MSGYNAAYALPADERPAGWQPGGAGEAEAAPAGRPSPVASSLDRSHLPPANPNARDQMPDRGVGFQLEADAIAETLRALRTAVDQIGTAEFDLTQALAERRWADFNVAAARLAALSGHLLRAIEQRRPRKGRPS